MTTTKAKATEPGAETDDERRWEAVRIRDKAADGQFYYAVRTTGVFCRPSCPARLALRQNVSFHASPADARRAGFRPCKRCRPEDDRSETAAADGIRRACRLIDEADEQPTLAALARTAGLSRFHFHRRFKAALGVTPKQYAAMVRARRLEVELRQSPTVTDAIYGAGYNSSSRFYEESGAVLGMTATAFRGRGEGEVIAFALGHSSLGLVLVATTEKGVCAIILGDSEGDLVADLRHRFARAEIRGPEPCLREALAKVIGLVEQPASGLDLPLDIRGTAFQAQVWAALRRIPPGTTASYQEIARRIGRPTAARAVAKACADNALAIAVPCHRVVRTDGGLSGYRWGIERKREILRREGGGS